MGIGIVRWRVGRVEIGVGREDGGGDGRADTWAPSYKWCTRVIWIYDTRQPRFLMRCAFYKEEGSNRLTAISMIP